VDLSALQQLMLAAGGSCCHELKRHSLSLPT
jgi:hypothetical protein